jgi:hypothetical protein
VDPNSLDVELDEDVVKLKNVDELLLLDDIEELLLVSLTAVLSLLLLELKEVDDVVRSKNVELELKEVDELLLCEESLLLVELLLLLSDVELLLDVTLCSVELELDEDVVKLKNVDELLL